MRATRTGQWCAVRGVVHPLSCRGDEVVIITNEGVLTAAPHHRDVYERVVAALGLDPDDIAEVRVGERGIEVDVVDFEDPDWPLRTLTMGRPVGWVGADERRVRS